jgi:signal transduction histidine kinase
MVPPDGATLRLIAALASPAARSGAARVLAEHLGAVALYGFVLDPEVDALVPAPGFAGTLPGGAHWRVLLTRLREPGLHRGEVSFPSSDQTSLALGLAAPPLALVLVGGQPDPARLEVLTIATPLLAALFRAEHEAVVAAGSLEVVRAAANEASALAVALDGARSDLERTVGFNELFVGILGHDLRSPLASILMSAEVLLRQAEDDKVIRPLRRIRSGGERMARMIDQLLDFTRARIGGGIGLERRVIDLQEVVKQTLDEFEATHPNWTFTRQVSGSLLGHWDPDRLAQVFSNLVGNAVEHGVPIAPLHLRLDGSSSDEVEVEITNRGLIPRELLPILFDPFRGAANKGKGRRGLGLGLFITNEIVSEHGGTIAARSEEQSELTSFLIRLPRATGGRSEASGDPDTGAVVH